MELYQLIDMNCGIIVNLCVVLLVTQPFDFIQPNVIRKLANKVVSIIPELQYRVTNPS